MPYQLRIYTINRGRMQDFVQAWRNGVYPLRLAHGFVIPQAWIMAETNQFIWHIGYEGTEEWEQKEAAYYQSVARKALYSNPAQWIARAEEHFVDAVPLDGGCTDSA